MEQTTLFTGARIIDSCAKAPLSDHDLLIVGKTIQAVAPSGSLSLPEQCQRLDCRGKTILPGLINSHCHLNLNPGLPQQPPPDESMQMSAYTTVSSLQDALQAGITYVRDCGGPPFTNIYAKQAVQQHIIAGSEVLACGQMLAMTGGHGWKMGARQCDGEAEARKAAREQFVAGADFLKLMATGGYATPGAHPKAPQLTVAEMRAAVEVAHQAGKRTTAHANGVQGIGNALAAGIDTIEHGEFFADEDEAAQERVIAQMLERGVYWVPTLMTWFAGYQEEFGYQGPIREEFIHRRIARRTKTASDPSHWQEEYYSIAETIAGMKKIAAAGVPIALGNDAGFGFVSHNSLVFEMKLMAFFGLSPLESILAATRTSAENLGIDNAYGSLEPGKVADLLIVSGDPLQDLDLLWQPEQVYKWGVPVKA